MKINEHHGQITEHHEKTTKKGTPAENQTAFSEMDENNGKMNVTWV